ncbi:MAG: hypothetical protein IPJ45_09495 [Ignavibacteria bacterium]|nr:hypothetical protein [Ignavibacteria bacterium]
MYKTVFADLDSNGFEELYLITKTGKSGFIKILGIASYNDSVFKEIVTAPYDSIKLADKRKPIGDSIYYLNRSFIIKKFFSPETPINYGGGIHAVFGPSSILAHYPLKLDSIYKLIVHYPNPDDIIKDDKLLMTLEEFQKNKEDQDSVISKH